MISAKELHEVQFAMADKGYSTQEVDFVIESVANTIEAYEKQSDELYHKLEVLASKVEEYRQRENAINTALVRAESLAETVKKEANDEAQQVKDEANATAKAVVDEATEKAAKITVDADTYAKTLIEQKDIEAKEIIINAQTKANEAINSAKVVAADILDQAKTISEDLIAKSKAEKEAYDILINAIKSDAKAFIEKAKALYTEQLDALNSANLDVKSDETVEAGENLADIKDDVVSLVDEIQEVAEALPEVEEMQIIDQPVEDIIADEPELEMVILPTIEEEEETVEEVVEEAEKEFTPIFDEVEEVEEVEETEEVFEIEEVEEEPIDPMAAVAAFTADEITPIEISNIMEINEDVQLEEGSLFETEESNDFENYFSVNQNDVHGDLNETISLLPPDEDDEDDAPHFKGFFRKKK